jgi:peptide/nickel transport system substrate-binding protein
VGCAIALVGCSDDDGGGSTADPVKGGELTIAMGSLTPDLDPLQYNTPPNTFPMELFYDSLTSIDTADGSVKVVPNLAVSWDRVDDTTWDFELEKGLKFSNGEPVDATSVKATADFVLDPDNAKGQTTRLNTIDEVEVVDADTLRVHTTAPDPLLPARMSVLPVLPAKAFAAGDEMAFYADPIGTGPWKVDEWVSGEKLVIVPNEDAFGGAPALDKITFTVIPEASSRVAALRSGDVDIVHKLPTDQMSSVEDAGARVVSAVESGTYVVDAIADSGPLADVRVRQALNYAIDKDGLVEGIMGGLGEVDAAQFSNPGFTGHCDDIEPYPFDPDKARELLKEAGYADGLDLTMQTSNGYILNDGLLAEAISEMLADVGVNVDLDIMEYSTYLDAFYDQKQRADLYAWRASNNPFFDADLAMQFWMTDNPVHPTAYSNPEYDRVFTQSRSELDETRRGELVCQASDILREDAPVIFGLHVPDVWAASDDVATFEVGQDGIPKFTQIQLAG